MIHHVLINIIINNNFYYKIGDINNGNSGIVMHITILDMFNYFLYISIINIFNINSNINIGYKISNIILAFPRDFFSLSSLELLNDDFMICGILLHIQRILTKDSDNYIFI